MLKIGIDASRANIENKTGTEWYNYYVLEELKKLTGNLKDCQFVLYSEMPFEENLKKDLPDNFSLKQLKWPPKFLWTQIRLSLEMLFHKPDVLFIPAHVIPLIHPKKVILTLHDIGFERIPELYDSKPIGPKNKVVQAILNLLVRIVSFGKYKNNDLDYNRWATRYGFKHATTIITVSEFSKKDMVDFYKVDPNKIQVVSGGFEVEKFTRQVEESEIQNSLDKYKIDKPYLYFVGRLEAKKNIENLVRAFNILKNKFNSGCKLVLAGKPGFKYEEVSQLIKEYNLEKEIIKTGYVDERDRVNLLKGAKAFVFPSNYEGFGIPVLEAQAAEVPVICSGVTSLPEIAGKGALYFDPQNPEEIAQTVNKLINDQVLQEELTQKGFENIKKYSWQETTEKILKILLA